MDAPAQKIRLFIALPTRITPRLSAVVDRLSATGRAVRPVRPEQMHLTLKFLGDVPTEWLPRVREALDDVARSTKPFAWSVQGLGAFPTLNRPRVLWAGCAPKEPLVLLSHALDYGLFSQGFEREHGGFKPHLTLARLRGTVPNQLRRILETPDSTVLAEEQATSIVLYQSKLQNSGAVHQPLHEAKLTGL